METAVDKDYFLAYKTTFSSNWMETGMKSTE
jgi:hypothetical protein